MDSYFLNICDGEPTFSNQQCSYSGRNALLHTKKMVGQIKDMGIQVMSYFVGGSSYSSSSDNFKTMYGSDSRFIDVKQIVPIIKTMNELFMKKA
jgi:nitric oxide reductase activation protein